MESYNIVSYKGVLEGQLFSNKPDEITINMLLKNNIIEKEENYLSGKNSLKFCFPLEYNNQSYGLNKSLLFEIYEVLRFHIEAVLVDCWNDGLDAIVFKLESFLKVDEKVSFLTKCYSDNFPKDKWFSIYSKKLFPDGEINGVISWKEWVFLNIENSPNLLRLYLMSTEEYFMNVLGENRKVVEEVDGLVDLFGLLKDWALFYEKENVLLFIKSKIEELKGIKIQSSKLLKELFLISDKYDDIILKLEYEERIKKQNDSLEIIIPEEFKNSPEAFKVSLAVYLQNSGYIKQFSDDIDIVRAMNNTFLNCNLSKQNYNYFKNSTRQQEYFKYFNNI